MRRDAVNLDLTQCRNFFEKLQGFVLGNAHAPHSGIDFKIDGHGLVARHAIEILRFFKSGNRRDETAMNDCRSFSRQRGTKNHDRMRKRPAQLYCFLQICNAE